MMHPLRTLVLLGTAAVMGAPGLAHAAFTPVASLAGTSLTFTDAAGKVYTGPAVYPSATFTASNGNVLERDQANTSYIDSNYAPGTPLIAQCGFAGLATCVASGSTTILFTTPVLGFTIGADDFDTTQTYTFTLQAFDGTTLLGSVTGVSLADNAASPAILAATSTTPVTSVVITDTAASAPDGDFVLGNIATLSAFAVPEPASLLVLGTATLFFGRLRARGKRV